MLPVDKTLGCCKSEGSRLKYLILGLLLSVSIGLVSSRIPRLMKSCHGFLKIHNRGNSHQIFFPGIKNINIPHLIELFVLSQSTLFVCLDISKYLYETDIARGTQNQLHAIAAKYVCYLYCFCHPSTDQKAWELQNSR